MGIETLPEPEPGSDERLPTTLAFALLIHGVIILGVTFAPEDLPGGGASAIEVTLVQQRSANAPDDADYLAQANLIGAGNTTELVRPRAPFATSSAVDLAGIPIGDEWLTATPGSADTQDPDRLKAHDPVADTLREVVTATRSDAKLAADARPVKGMDAPRLMIAHLLEVSQSNADPLSDVNQTALAHADRPRERFIAVNTRESRYARYLEAWRTKVERIGNRDYPDEARREHLAGRVVLEVVLNADGTLRSLEPRRRSGTGLLDDAAIHSVREAAPFAPFPPEVRAEADVLRFLYEWRYSDGNLTTLTTRG